MLQLAKMGFSLSSFILSFAYFSSIILRIVLNEDLFKVANSHIFVHNTLACQGLSLSKACSPKELPLLSLTISSNLISKKFI